MPTKLQKNQIATTLIDGWTPADATWTYASASTITVPSGAASIYQKGDRIKWTQTTVKYGVIVAVADTLLTIAVNTDYTVANAAISANYYSHQANPLGFPPFFNYTYTPTGFSSNPTSVVARYSIINTTFTAMWNEGSAGTSNNTAKTLQFPVSASASTCPTTYVISVIDNNVQAYGKILITASTGTFNLYPSAAGVWTASGVCKTANGGATISYEF